MVFAQSSRGRSLSGLSLSMLSFWIALFLSLSNNAAVAQGTDQTSKQKKFAGWGGLSVYCTLNPENPLSKGLCLWARQKLNLLAKPLNIPVLIVEKNSDRFSERARFQASSKISTLLDVDIQIFSYGPSLFAGVRVGNFYTSAVETMEMVEAEEAKPRSGTLILWEKSIIGNGTGTDFQANIRQSTETLLMEFLSDFSDGR